MKIREYTAGEISAKAIEELSLRGAECWRNNNMAVRGRKFIGRKGVPDVTGFMRRTGVAVYSETKKIGDTMKEDQIEFLTQAKKAGCFCFIASQCKETGKFLLKEFEID